MSVEADFSTVSEADEAYFGGSSNDDDPGDGGDDGDSSTTWGDVQRKAELDYGFSLLFQNSTSGDRTRWFVTRGTEAGEIEAVTSGGETTTVSPDVSLDEVPHYDSENDARAAYKKWEQSQEDAGDEGEQTDDATEWSKWRVVREVAPWFVFGRSSSDGEEVQFVVAGKNQEDVEVYLQPDGSVGSEPHTYETFEAVKQALAAFSTKSENGEIPENMMPTGGRPSVERVTKATRTTTTQTSSRSSAERVVEKLAGQPVLLGAVGVAGLYVVTQRGEQ